MKSKKRIKNLLYVVFFLTMSMPVFAQTGEDPDDEMDLEDAELNPAPIGDYIIPMLVLGVATAFILLRKRTAQKV